MYNTNNNLILQWYDINKRDLPWRLTTDPYKIWVSEVMLQQTQVSTVIPYYNNWIKNFPTIFSVANSRIDVLLKMWEGLGYYTRCRNFHKASKIVVTKYSGIIPNNYNIIISLPGVGNYVASAILSIAFNNQLPALDTNLKRVISRILGIKTLTKRNNNRILKYAQNLVQCDRPGDINQALMDIGSQICTTNKAICVKCPNQNYCKANESGKQLQYPKSISKRTIPTKKMVAAFITLNGNILIKQRRERGLLSGLWEFPTFEYDHSVTDSEINMIFNKNIGNDINIEFKIGSVKHSYSHFKTEVEFYVCSKKHKNIILKNSKWIKPDEFERHTFSKATHKLFQLIKKNKND